MYFMNKRAEMRLMARNKGRSTSNMIQRLGGEKAIFVVYDLTQ